MKAFLSSLSNKYTITPCDNGVELTRWFTSEKELADMYFTTPFIIEKARKVSLSSECPVVLTVSVVAHAGKTEGFDVLHCSLNQPAAPPNGERPINNYSLNDWIVKKQLLKDSGYQPSYNYFNWEEAFEKVKRYQIPPILHGFHLREDLLFYPFLLANSCFIQNQSIFSYVSSNATIAVSVSINQQGTFILDTSNYHTDCFSDIMAELQKELKKQRLRLLFEKQSARR